MSLQNLSRFYWFVIDTKQVRDVAVFVSLSAKHCSRKVEAVVRSRIRTSGCFMRLVVWANRFKGL